MAAPSYPTPGTADPKPPPGSIRWHLAEAARLWAAEFGVHDENTMGPYSTAQNQFLYAAENVYWAHAFRPKVHGR